MSYPELADTARRAAEREARRLKEEKENQRREYLEELGKREDELWDRVNELVSEKQTKAYDEAVQLLRGLDDLWSTRENRKHFLNAVRSLADEFPRLSEFRHRLAVAGWLEPKTRDLRLLNWKREQ